MTKTCPCCSVQKDLKDFDSKDRCWKCVYFEKYLSPNKAKHCKLCHTILPSSRWAYCSSACAKEAKHQQDKNYWPRHLKTEKFHWACA